MQLTVTSVVTSLVSGMTLWNFSSKYYILFRLDFRMLLKQGTRNEERGASKATGRRKEGSKFNWHPNPISNFISNSLLSILPIFHFSFPRTDLPLPVSCFSNIPRFRPLFRSSRSRKERGLIFRTTAGDRAYILLCCL